MCNDKSWDEASLVLRLLLWTTVGFSWIDISVTQSQTRWMDLMAQTRPQRMLSGNTVSTYDISSMFAFDHQYHLKMCWVGGLIQLFWEQLSVYISGIRRPSTERRCWLSRGSTMGCSRTRPDFHRLSGGLTTLWRVFTFANQCFYDKNAFISHDRMLPLLQDSSNSGNVHTGTVINEFVK